MTNQLTADTMSAAKQERFSFRAMPGTMEALDELRRAEKDVPSRSQMVERLIQRARAAQIAAEAKAKKKGGD
jgi:hypothetical protein